MKNQRIYQKTRGFTLLEVLFAMSIISIAAISLSGMLFTVIETNRNSENHMDAVNMTQTLLSKNAAYFTTGAGLTDVYANLDGCLSAPITAGVTPEQTLDAKGCTYAGRANLTYDLYTRVFATAGPSKEVLLQITTTPVTKNGKPYEGSMLVMKP